MKLVQLNIWQGKLLKEVVQFLEQQDADIVCVQEVFSSSRSIAVLDLASSLETIQEKTPYPHVFFAPTFAFDVSGVKVSFGNAILSKFPLENVETVFTNQAFHDVDSWDNHPPNTRNAQLTDVVLPNGMLTIVNHHGYHELSPVGSGKTVSAMEKLTSAIKSRGLEHPIIIAGDLNVTAASPAMRLFDGWLRDLTSEYHVSDTLTRFGKVSGVPCDHILVSEQVKVSDFQVSEELVSDHKALILEFDL